MKNRSPGDSASPKAGSRAPARNLLSAVVAMQLFALAAAPAMAGEDASLADVRELDSVVVVGSRRGYASELESPAPIQVAREADLRATGARTLSEALQRLIPSFSFPTSAASSNAASFVKGVALRGLAADQTLVLVNGKRRHASAQLNASSGVTKGAQTVDLNSIPLSAIERVEVLLDGASAQYGSDAVAGVVNIVLRRDADGANLSAQYGQFDQGDGESGRIAGGIGFALPGDGFLNLSFDAWDIHRARASVTDTRQMYFPGDARESGYPYRDWFYGSGASRRENLFVNAESALGAVTVYGFGSYGRRRDEGFGNLRQPSSDQTVRALFPDGFQPWLHVRSRDASATFGAKWSTLALGDFDLSATHGRNRVESIVSNTNNASLGVDGPTSFDTGDLSNEQTSVNLDWKRSFDVDALAAPLQVAGGLTYRDEAYEVFEGDYGSWANGGVPVLDGPNAGNVATPASQGFGGFSPDDAGRYSRSVHGGYVELEADLTARLSATVSGRAEHYSDFGGTADGRLALRYAATPALAWRLSTGSGYRAPSLGQTAYSRTIPNITDGVLATNRLARIDSVEAVALGATSLTPEESVNVSTGLVWTPTDGFSATLDVYRIDIDDRIVLSETLSGTLVRQVLADAGFPTYSGLQYFTNAVDTRTRGVDATVRQSLRLGAGHRLELGAAYNWNQTEITAIKETPEVLASAGLSLIGRESASYIETANPRSSTRLSADYASGAVDTHLSAVRYGSYTLRRSNADNDQTFAPQVVVGAGAGYRFNSAFKLSLGVNNLFDSHPDEVLAAVRNPVVSIYSNLSPEGGFGRYYYARAELSF